MMADQVDKQTTAQLTQELGDAVEHLRRGGVVLHATEGVWGFACDPLQPEALAKLFALKNRDQTKGLILIGATEAEFRLHLRGLDHVAQVRSTWPGAHTWILPNRDRFSSTVTGGRDTVACRVPGHEQARQMCALFGGVLVSTSANLSGEAPVLTYAQAQQQFAGQVDCIVAGEVLTPGVPSTIHGLDGSILRGTGATSNPRQEQSGV